MQSGPAMPRAIVSLRSAKGAGCIQNHDVEAEASLRVRFRSAAHAAAPTACPALHASVDFRSQVPSCGEGRARSALQSAFASDRTCARRCEPCCKFEQSRCLHLPHREGIKSPDRCAESVASAWTMMITQLQHYRIDTRELVEAMGARGFGKSGADPEHGVACGHLPRVAR
jgi:hypothetical protein